jgi:hypothetical protein
MIHGALSVRMRASPFRSVLGVVCAVLAVLPLSVAYGASMQMDGNSLVISGASVVSLGDKTVSGPQAELHVEGPSNVIYHCASGSRIEVVPAEGLSRRTELIDNKLVVRSAPYQIEIWGPSLDAIKLAGSRKIEVLDVSADRFTISLEGSSNVRVTGQANTVEASLSGSGHVDLSALHALAARGALVGGGELLLHASEQVDTDVRGQGQITVEGNPTRRHAQQTGNGKVRFVQ